MTMNSSITSDEHPLIVIHNIENLSLKDIERYCSKFDKNLQCFRRKNRFQHQYAHVLFSSMITATNFLQNRPHFIRNIRVNSSFVSDPLTGGKFVCVRVDRNSTISEDDLYYYTTKRFGRVLNCAFYVHRGYAFIEFDRFIDAQRALESSNNRINSVAIEFLPRHNSTKIISPSLSLTRLVHIGNFSRDDQEKIRRYFSDLKSFTIHENCYGQRYILGLFDIQSSIELLLRRAFCLNGRVLNVFIGDDDQLTECDNYLLVRHVPFRLTDYNLFEYFSQFGRILNCYRYGQTDAYRIQYRDRNDFNRVIESNRIHLIKTVRLQVEREKN